MNNKSTVKYLLVDKALEEPMFEHSYVGICMLELPGARGLWRGAYTTEQSSRTDRQTEV